MINFKFLFASGIGSGGLCKGLRTTVLVFGLVERIYHKLLKDRNN